MTDRELLIFFTNGFEVSDDELERVQHFLTVITKDVNKMIFSRLKSAKGED